MSSAPAVPRPRRVVFLGTPAIAVPSLEALVRSGESVVAVVTQPDRPAGRGRRATPPPVKLAAERLGLFVLQPPTLRRRSAVAELRTLRPDIIVIVAFGQILREDVLHLPPLGCVNLHPSLLPKLRGPTPINWAILEGLRETGVTVMVVDERMDAGPILSQETAPILPDDTAESLGARLATQGADLLVRTLDDFAERRAVPRIQEDADATYSRLLRHADGQIDWHSAAVEIERRARAFYPWPGAYTSWNERHLKLAGLGLEEVHTGVPTAEPPGTVLGFSRGGSALVVATGQGALLVSVLQLEGRRSVPASEFVRGHPGVVGSRLG